ncbi:hypothetical protein EDB81DRAFT_803546 [Dactylonectria macrodidyma]|uniref:Uncharacterized protein n=1 Tax=Dactylonectria macrodidyma TaxID=307937 RepID=A0A9P9EAB8_9HYPO|nr:hypothetical protein EDB81DRAFT_803546 [Dactylonectria macrodidyma]
MSTLGLVLKFNEVKEVVAQYGQKFDAIKPPRDVYHENRAAVKAGIAQTWAYMAANPDPSDMSKVQKIVEFGGRLKEMEMKPKASIDDDDKAYETTLETAMEGFCDDLVNALGVDMVTKALQKLPKRRTDHGGSDETVNEPHDHVSTPEGCLHREQQSIPGVEGPDHIPKGNHEETSRSRKRRRIDGLQAGERERRNSTNATAGRTSSAKAPKRTGHQNPRRSSTKEQNISSTPEAVGVQTRQSRARVNQEDAEAIIDPTPGSLYFAFRQKSKEWSAALLLPKSNLEDFGIPSTLEQLGLMENIPACYVYNKDTYTFRWRKGYREGQPMAQQRQFPVMFFDGLPFPAKSEVAWMTAKDMRPLDITVTHASLIPHHQSVFKYMKERAAIAAQESMASISGDGNQDEVLDDAQPRHDSPVGLGINHGSPNQSSPDELDKPSEPPAQVPRSEPGPSSLVNPSEAIKEAQDSPALDPVVLINDQHVSSPEIISVASSPIEAISHTDDDPPVEELIGDLIEKTPVHLQNFDDDRDVDEIFWARDPTSGKLRQVRVYDAEVITDVSLSDVPVPKSVPAEIASRTESHPGKEVVLPERERQPIQQHNEPVPGALLATMSVWTQLVQARPTYYLPPDSPQRQDKFSPIHDRNPQTHEPQHPMPPESRAPPESNKSSSFSSGLPIPVQSATVSGPYLPKLLDRPPSDPLPSVSTFSAVPSLLDEADEVCRLPPIASSRRQNGVAWSIPSFDWPGSASRSHVQNQDDQIDLDRSPLFPAADAPYLGSTHQNSSRFAMMAFSSPPGEASMTSTVPKMSPMLGPPIPSGNYPWPERLSQSVVQRLETYIRFNNLPPGLQGMINYQGLYLCPLCDQAKRKGYIRVATFVNHLQKKH